MSFQHSFRVNTSGRGTTDITTNVQAAVKQSAIKQGIAHVFIHHTSASLMLCENADPAVLTDLETFMGKLAPDGDPMFTHTAEGPDDMPAHVRSVLTQTGLSIPINAGSCDLGTWQGVYLWEHRTAPHQRRITVTILG
jgi:secondary thiamine-phosphate synthase enzyme